MCTCVWGFNVKTEEGKENGAVLKTTREYLPF